MLQLTAYSLIVDTHGQDELPVVGMLMPSFCQVMVGLGEPVALQGRVMGLLRITSRVGGWNWITGSSEETDGNLFFHNITYEINAFGKIIIKISASSLGKSLMKMKF